LTDDAAMRLKSTNLATEQGKMKVLIGDNKKAADKQIADQKDATKSLKKSTSSTITALGTKNAAAIKKD